MNIGMENLEDKDLEIKIKELLKMGYVRVDDEFLHQVAKMFYKNEDEHEERYKKFIEDEKRRDALIGIICKNSAHSYSEEFIKSHDLTWFEMQMSIYK